MKLKEFFSSVVKNKSNGQLSTSFKKGKLKEYGVSKDDLMDMQIDDKLNKLLFK